MRLRLMSLVVALGFVACRGGLFGRCGNTVKDEVPSPSGSYIATITERNCGATTDFSTLVSLHDARKSFDPRKQKPVLVLVGRPHVDLTWNADNELAIRSPAGATFRKVEEWRDVRIVYK